MRVADALDLCSKWLPFFERNTNRWFGQMMRPVRDAANVASGRMSEGLRALQAGIADSQARDMWSAATIGEIAMLGVYVSVACQDVKPSFGALVRNPWFVFTQAPFAAHKALALIERLRIDLPERNSDGSLGGVDLCDGRLHVRQGKTVQARECLERVRRRLRDAGIDHVPAPVAALAAEIERSR